MQKVSREFIFRLKTGADPAYRIAQRAGLRPDALSKLIHGIDPLRQDDPRILRVAELLGLRPDEAFEATAERLQ